MSPEQIRLVQRTLNAQGYPVEVTSAWDKRTRAALTSFQTAHALPATGDLDPATSQALGVDPADVMPVRATAAEDAAASDDPAVNRSVNNTVDGRPGP